MNYDEILSSIRKILRGLNLESKRIQKEYGISIPQLLCLNILNEKQGYQSTVKDLAVNMNLNPSTVSGIIKRLMTKGLVAKLPNPADRRGALIALTQEGAKVVRNSPALMHDRLNEKLRALSPDEIEKLRQALGLLTDLMGIEELDASPIIVEGTIDA